MAYFSAEFSVAEKVVSNGIFAETCTPNAPKKWPGPILNPSHIVKFLISLFPGPENEAPGMHFSAFLALKSAYLSAIFFLENCLFSGSLKSEHRSAHFWGRA